MQLGIGLKPRRTQQILVHEVTSVPKNLDIGSMWQHGPVWIREPFERWPVREDFKKHDVPGLKKEFELLSNIYTVAELVAFDKYTKSCEARSTVINAAVVTSAVKTVVTTGLGGTFDIEKFGCWFKLLRVTAKVLSWHKNTNPK